MALAQNKTIPRFIIWSLRIMAKDLAIKHPKDIENGKSTCNMAFSSRVCRAQDQYPQIP
jgi:hypothetical protein